MPKQRENRIEVWVRAHASAAAVLLTIACVAVLCALFYFVVFSDFGGSADFIYNQF